ncbi:MAG TPA: AI-2E family transporter [Patescibacteria group bacterium]|nr:AI-2E family transporter [Patescibacteria group bacterium]
MFSPVNASRVGLVVVVALIAIIWLFKPILPPFLIGVAVAYLLDPAVNGLTRRGLSRTLAGGIVLVTFFAIIGIILTIALPLLGAQISQLVGKVPEYGRSLGDLVTTHVMPYLHAHVDEATFERIKDALGGASSTVFSWLGGIAQGLLTSSGGLFSVVSIAFIAPIISFYLIRDWPHAIAWIGASLPRRFAPTVTVLATEIDERVAAFFRGQGMVALSLATYYSLGLALVGLEFGFVIGLGAGLLSFIPYVGLITGLLTATILAIVQFQNAADVAMVVAVFVSAQFLDAGFLTPKLVGERVGLHPVWIIFSVMGGGLIAGFTGILLAVPTAAAVGVILSHLMERYKASDLYRVVP